MALGDELPGIIRAVGQLVKIEPNSRAVATAIIDTHAENFPPQAGAPGLHFCAECSIFHPVRAKSQQKNIALRLRLHGQNLHGKIKSRHDRITLATDIDSPYDKICS